MLLVAGLVLPSLAWGHGNWEQAIPEQPGARFGAGLAVSAYEADTALPDPRLAGVLLKGQSADDRRDQALEHGALDAGWRVNDRLGVTAGVGWHGRDDAHLEALWISLYQPAGAGLWEAGLGRRRVPIGPVFEAAGNFDRFGLMPLAKRAAFDGDWLEDGLNLRWRRAGPVPLEIDVGVWRGHMFPGSDAADAFPAVHVGADVGHGRVDAFLARLGTDGRGAAISRSGTGHSHGSPSCEQSLMQVACFEGDVDVAGASVRWYFHEWDVNVTMAGLLRREHGNLYSSSGDASYSGLTKSGWLEASWDFASHWNVAARLEGVRGDHDLSGYGAGLVAQEAGLLPDPDLLSRATLAVSWAPRDSLTLAVEAGEERNDLNANRFVGIRLIWRDELRVSQGPEHHHH